MADVAYGQTCKIISFTSLRPEKCKNTSDAPLPVGGASEADATTNQTWSIKKIRRVCKIVNVKTNLPHT